MQNILIGVTGSIAAYKSAELVRQLKKSGYNVRVVMTASATEIITPMTLQVLSQNPVRNDLFHHEDEAKIDHISLARWAHQFIIAPATANFIAKMACGLADDLLSTICLATDAPIAIAPAMNRLMWAHPATQANIVTLQSRGVQVIAPESGEQACGEEGAGRMASPENIVQWLDKQLASAHQPLPLKGLHLIITAGATIERIDPVRYITNDSSGKMGYALAEQAQHLGANVTLITGKTALPKPKSITVIEAFSAKAMYQATMNIIDTADWFIATAAVADFAVAEPATQKIKKSEQQEILQLTLVPNPDILRSVCERKTTHTRQKPLFCIGFAAETQQVIANAKAKRLKKGADLIIANDVSDSRIGFNSDNNAVTLIGQDIEKQFAMMPKTLLAKELLLSVLAYQQQQK